MTKYQVGVPPDVLRWIPRNAENADCGITVLQLACGLTYESVLTEAVKIHPHPVTAGLYLTEVIDIARRLGYKITKRLTYDIQEDTGILSLLGTRKKQEGHVVYLWKGRIVEPVDHTLWLDPDDFLKFNKYRATALFVIKEK